MRTKLILRMIAGSVTVLFLLGGVTVLTAYRADMSRARGRIGDRSALLSSPYGVIEYLQGGEGPPVLVVHGSGGGFDQGELIARSFLDPGFRWIAPSRFGYLRSSVHDGATFDEQAHAYAALLDELHVEQVAVVAFSHGGPSALLFAALHPERVSSLILVSPGVAASPSTSQEGASSRGDALRSIFDHDWLYWGLTRFFRRSFMGLMGATEDVVAGLTAEQRAMVDGIIDGMNPVSLRSAGVRFDNQAALPGDRIAAIAAPTLIFHATDDTLQVFHNAEFAASTIPGAELIRYERGGHLVMAVERSAIRGAIGRHILAHAPP